MKLPNWIQKILRREPAQTLSPSLSVKEVFLEYLKKPSVENFLAVRQKVAESDRYAPYSNELDVLAANLFAEDPQAAIEYFWRTFPSLLLSPSAHMTLSKAYNSTGQKNEAAFEKALAFQLIKSIFATGKGTKKAEICFVLCDLTMPLMDGWETITSLRKLSPDIPVILTSGFNEAQVMAGDHPTLPDAFLSKPYVRKELIAAIGQALSVKN